MTTWTDYSDADDATFRAVADRIEAAPEVAEAWRGENRERAAGRGVRQLRDEIRSQAAEIKHRAEMLAAAPTLEDEARGRRFARMRTDHRAQAIAALIAEVRATAREEGRAEAFAGLVAAEQRGAEQVAQRMRELAEEWDAEHDYGPIFADRIRAALADVAPPTAGREGRDWKCSWCRAGNPAHVQRCQTCTNKR